MRLTRRGSCSASLEVWPGLIKSEVEAEVCLPASRLMVGRLCGMTVDALFYSREDTLE